MSERRILVVRTTDAMATRVAIDTTWTAQRLSRKTPSVAPGAQITTSSSLETADFVLSSAR